MSRILFAASVLALASCATPTIPPTARQLSDISRFNYVILESSQAINSISASEGNVSTKRLNPTELIEGILLRRNVVRVNSKSDSPDLKRTLLVRWGISGRRDVLLGLGGYTQEVTMALLDASNMQPVYTCTAEGIGETEADHIRKAITNCLSGIK